MATYNPRMIGSHLSIAGGMYHALDDAHALGMECVQVFTKNQRQWRVAPLADADVAQWEEHRRSTGIACVVSHDSYLINLAAPDGPTRDKSIALFADEIERCERLAIPWLVTHPGAHVGQGEDVGLERVAQALDAIHARLAGYRTVTCLEITAGQGTTLGYRLEHLKRLMDLVHEPQRLAVCLDTAHLLAAGYDLTSAAGAQGVIAEVERTVGVERVKVLHVNDSKTPRGSRVDRHEHWGHGHVALAAVAVFLNHPVLGARPMILETPKEDAPDGRPWDAVNMETLLGLVDARPTQAQQTPRARVKKPRKRQA